ncbi:unknown protein (plasmid) [Simkania negevensis Z]|uniref:Uncharacterized protein n=2 Tax=Simkania negevensis TaxID=83561 RepID=F8L301_SIMNZ|nr:unknown protein [Simkania negevensis Z]
MTEDEMQNRLQQFSKQEDLDQLRFPFVLKEQEDSGFSSAHLKCEGKSVSKLFRWENNLMHTINQAGN